MTLPTFATILWRFSLYAVRWVQWLRTAFCEFDRLLVGGSAIFLFEIQNLFPCAVAVRIKKAASLYHIGA